MGNAVWSFSGGRITQLWMLTIEHLRETSDENLAAICASHGLQGLTSRNERLDALGELLAESQTAAIKDKAKAAAIKDKGKVLALKDKKYLKKLGGQKVSSAKAAPKSSAKSKAK